MELQEALDKIAELTEAVEKLSGEKEALKGKNSELLGKYKVEREFYAKHKDVDFDELVEIKNKVESKELRDNNDVKSLIESSNKPLKDELKALQELLVAKEKERVDFDIKSQVTGALTDSALNPDQLFKLWRSEYGFDIVDGEAVVKQGDSTEPLRDFIEAAKKNTVYQHHFKAPTTQGAGAKPLSKIALPVGPSGSIKNPFAKDTFNLRLQRELTAENPAYAESLQRAASS